MKKFMSILWIAIYVGSIILGYIDYGNLPFIRERNIWSGFMSGVIILGFLPLEPLHAVRLASTSFLLFFAPLFISIWIYG